MLTDEKLRNKIIYTQSLRRRNANREKNKTKQTNNNILINKKTKTKTHVLITRKTEPKKLTLSIQTRSGNPK